MASQINSRKNSLNTHTTSFCWRLSRQKLAQSTRIDESVFDIKQFKKKEKKKRQGVRCFYALAKSMHEGENISQKAFEEGAKWLRKHSKDAALCSALHEADALLQAGRGSQRIELAPDIYLPAAAAIGCLLGIAAENQEMLSLVFSMVSPMTLLEAEETSQGKKIPSPEQTIELISNDGSQDSQSFSDDDEEVLGAFYAMEIDRNKKPSQ